jgi:TonB family protein
MRLTKSALILAHLSACLALTTGDPTFATAQVISGQLPRIIKHVEATYPDELRAKGIQGVVFVRITVGIDGRVTDATIVKSIPGLDPAAIAAVRQWEFDARGMTASATGTVMLSFNPLVQRQVMASESARPMAIPGSPPSAAAEKAPDRPRPSPDASASAAAPPPATGADRTSLSQDGGASLTLREFRTLPAAEQQRMLERFVNNVIAGLSSPTDANGQPKSEAQRRAHRAGANLTRALFTRAATEKPTDQPLGYVELYRQMKAPDAPLDKRVVDMLGDYLRRRDAQWIDEKILAQGDPDQERSLRILAWSAAANLYMDDFDAAVQEHEEALRELAEAREEERKARAELEIWQIVDHGSEMHRRGRHADELASYRRAATRGNASAMCSIAVMYGNGDGVRRNQSLDLEWSLKCAHAGNAYGMWRVSLAYSTDSDLSRNFFPSIPKNADESFAWALKAAQLGHKLAMRNLAEMYAHGRGTTRNTAEANRWMQLSQKESSDPLGAPGNSGK